MRDVRLLTMVWKCVTFRTKMIKLSSVKRYREKEKMRQHSAAVPDYCVCADNKLRPRVPLVIGDVVVRLKPDPLLTFSQETIVARLPFTILHH